MCYLFKNGFLVQHLYDRPFGMDDAINTCGYIGLSARNSNPLSMYSDKESQDLSKKAEWHAISDHEYIMMEFISDPNLLLRYIQACRERNIPVRLLFVESDYSGEVWTGPEPPRRFLGYEYSTIPIDNQVITDLTWYLPLAPFLKRVNTSGLFPTMKDVLLFKDAYDQAYARGEIGDGDMDTHIFCLFEVHPNDVLQSLLNEANSKHD